MSVSISLDQKGILEETVNVFVIDNPSSVYIPVGAPMAGKPSECTAMWYKSYYHSHPAPDTPNFLSQYQMIEGSDYAQQTVVINAIDDTLIAYGGE